MSARYPAGLSTRFVPLPFLTGPFPVPAPAPMAGWEFAEHPTEALVKKLLWNLMSLNVGELGRTVAASNRQIRVADALQRDIDRPSGFTSRFEALPGDPWYRAKIQLNLDTRPYEGHGRLDDRVVSTAGDALSALVQRARHLSGYGRPEQGDPAGPE